ncbi:hypothetical protein [Amycolatopsis rubida]|uniref:hypothetical protein n=1 Tax=Amycolatopsis rubida TaxID=112413 RepID=UPI0011607843|nr:hypothetical protein [Amycolatopsis rubida]
MTDPPDGQRDCCEDLDDVARRPTWFSASTEPLRHGRYSRGILDDMTSVRYRISYAPPVGTEVRGKARWIAGEGRSTDRAPEPEARGWLRQVCLPPLRDAS